jgi:hypothetical protein
VANLKHASGDLFHTVFFAQPRAPHADHPPRQSTEPFADGVLVTGVGHQTLAAVTAVDAFLPSRQATVVLLFGQQIDPSAQQAAVEIITSRAQGAGVVARQTPIGDEISLTRRVRNMLHGATGPVVLDVTAGTKAVTAALVRARATAPAHSGLANASIVARDPRTRSISRFPASAPGVAPLPTALPWEQLLSGIASPVAPQQVINDAGTRRLAHVGAAIASALFDKLLIDWWRPGQWPLLPAAVSTLC